MRVVLPGIRSWRHDLTHCLHTTMGVLLGFHGLDPLQVLGSGWGFQYAPGDVRREEYYFPCGNRCLLSSLAPHHSLSSRWHEPADAEQGWAQVRAAVAAGAPVAVAVDNFYLPFRPAYRDVHTNHLLAVYGFDDERRLVYVADPVPPRFTGPIRIETLTAARDSANPIEHSRDLFFTANPLANRWLSISVDGPQPPADVDFVRAALRANLDGFDQPPGDGAALRGLAGLREFLAGWLPLIVQGPHRIDEVFIVAGAILAITGLHAEFLADAARRLDRPALAELGREVDRVAHHWSALRIAVATARDDPGPAVPALRSRADSLLADQERVLRHMALLLPRL